MKSLYLKARTKYHQLKHYLYLGNILIFITKIFLLFLTNSIAFLISSSYNLCIGLARKKIYSKDINYLSVGFFLFLASLSFIIYSIWTIFSHKIVSYDLYSGITIATVTFFDIGYSIYGVVRSLKSHNSQDYLLMLINLSTALISLELTQSALLSFTQKNVDNSLYNGTIGIVVGICALIISIIICFKRK